MTEPSSERDPGSQPTTRDLYCLECGYNLRGQSGDPRRCPECGHLNPMGELELPAGLISAQLRRMETAPAICVGAAAYTLSGLCLALLVPVDDWKVGLFSLPCGCMVGPFLAVGLVFWFISLQEFKHSCLNKRGWRRALWIYHFYGLALIGAIAGMIVLSPGLGSKYRIHGWGYLLLVGIPAAVIIGGARRVQRKVRALLEPLQREVAVTLARDRLRWELERRW